MDLKHCRITIPTIPGSLYNGSYYIDDNKFHFWIEWDKANISFSRLFEFEMRHELFDAQIMADNLSAAKYSCFKCYFTSPIQDVKHCEEGKIYVTKEPFWREKNISVDCNGWIENIHLDSLSEKYWNEVSFRIPYTEPWFPSMEINIEVPLSNNDDIRLFVGEERRVNYYPNTRSSVFKNQIIYHTKETVFSIEEAVHTGIIVQAFLRYTAGIPFPPPVIDFIQKNDHGSLVYYRFHSDFGVKGLSEYAENRDYHNMPYKFEKLDLENSVRNWFAFCRQGDLFSAIINYCIGQNPDYINHRITLLTRSFDKLSQTEFTSYMEENEFNLFLDNTLNYIENESRGKFNRDRVRGLLSQLNQQTLKNRLMLVFEKMNSSLFKTQNDYRSIVNYLTYLRHAEAHSGYADISKLPDGYDYMKVLSIIDQANRFCIDNRALKTSNS